MPLSVPRSPSAQAASRRNGARSRGPATAQGKAQSARNAVKHGLLAALPRLAGELPAWLAALEKQWYAMVTPEDRAARALIDSAVMAALRLQRTEAMVDALFGELLDPGRTRRPQEAPEPGQPAEARRLMVLLGYEKRFRGQRDRALRQLAGRRSTLG